VIWASGPLTVWTQAKPYSPLAEAVKNLSVWEAKNVKGTVVGFYCPPFVQGLNVPGYHLHFVTEDRQQGGHLLECSLQEGTAQLDPIREFHLVLPAGSDFTRADLAGGRTEELKKIESR